MREGQGPTVEQEAEAQLGGLPEAPGLLVGRPGK